MNETTSHLLCPACEHRLRHGINSTAEAGQQHVVYCGWGPCPSGASNEGGWGATLELAYADLVHKIENEEQDLEEEA